VFALHGSTHRSWAGFYRAAKSNAAPLLTAESHGLVPGCSVKHAPETKFGCAAPSARPSIDDCLGQPLAGAPGHAAGVCGFFAVMTGVVRTRMSAARRVPQRDGHLQYLANVRPDAAAPPRPPKRNHV